MSSIQISVLNITVYLFFFLVASLVIGRNIHVTWTRYVLIQTKYVVVFDWISYINLKDDVKQHYVTYITITMRLIGMKMTSCQT